MKQTLFKVAALSVFMLCWNNRFALGQQSGTQTNGSAVSNLTTAVPFLLIIPDARSAGMGDVGAATAPDANSINSNPSKLAFIDSKYGFSVSYSPWLKSLVPDVSLSYLSGYYRIDKRNVLGASLRYFRLGNVDLIDADPQQSAIYNPNELAADFTFARKFGESFSLGTAIRYIRSNLSSGQLGAGQDTRASSAVSMDVSGYFSRQTTLFQKDAIISAGGNISNIGTKMGYANGKVNYFLPTNLKLGMAATLAIDDYSELTAAVDFNKLLVPTEPVYDSAGNIISGESSDKSVLSGILNSFSDAPGGIKEELQEISISTGVEYLYNKQFALRAGYLYENPDKGNRRYLTLGGGVTYNIFTLDFAYILASAQKSPLANTMRFSLLFNFNAVK
jgi:long-subunit fatty acid transport protein